MKKLLTKILPILTLLAIGSTVSAQDIITKKDGKKIRAHILEISDTKIKYNDFGDRGGLVFTLNRATIREIEFETGSTLEEAPPGTDASYYVDDKVNNLKINFTSFGNETLGFTYERSLNPTTSIEADLNIYGVGIEGDNNFGGGIGLALGYKVKLGNIFKGDEYRPKHVLHGGYLRPKVGLHFRRAQAYVWNGQTSSMRDIGTKRFGALGLELGKQWIFSNSLSLDVYFGFHYYAEGGGSLEGSDVNYYNEAQLGDMWGDENRAGSFGIKVGYLFGTKGMQKGKRSRR